MSISFKVPDVFLILVCAAGLFITSLQVQDHYFSDIERKSGERYNMVSAFTQTLCGAQDDTFSCDRVRRSGYADVKGFPLAAIGFVFYLFAGAVMISGRKFRDAEFLDCYTVTFAVFFIAAVMNSALFTLSAVKIKAYCPMCMIHYTLTFFGLGIVALHFIRRKVNPFRSIWSALKISAVNINAVLPQIVMCLIVGVVSVAAGEGINNFYKIAAKSHNENIIRKKADSLALEIYNQKPLKFSSRETGVLGNPAAPVTITVVTDFLCPACRDSAFFLEEFMKKRGDKIRIVYYNFPLDIACNPIMKKKLHDGACMLAQGSVCAAEENKLVQYIKSAYTRGKKGLAPADVENIAVEAGIDKNRFAACMASGVAQKKVKEQIDDAILLGINATPAVFINGKVYKHKPNADVLDALINMELKNKE